MIPFTRSNGTVTATFTALERELITDLASSIAQLLHDRAASTNSDDRTDSLFDAVGMGGSLSVSADPAIARLLPDAYGDDAGAATEFRQLTERSLATRKVANARCVIDTLADSSGAGGSDRNVTVVLDDAVAQSWLRAISDIRLAVAARLGIEKDEDDEDAEDAISDDVDGDARADRPQGANQSPAETTILRDVYNWLAYVLESLVTAIDVDPGGTAQ